ncbi:DUF2796 domain-containing protein [Pseudomonas sp. Marseille-QA0332]
MRRSLLALPFALLPLAMAQAHEAHDHDHEHQHEHAHGSLGAHEHGVAQLNVVLDGKNLKLELESPAMNLVGFEHLASSDADKAKVAAVRQQLVQPTKLFGLSQAAGCSETAQELESPLFADQPAPEHKHEHEHEHAHESEHQHSDIHAHYQLTCTAPGKLAGIDLTPLFQAFPATRTINVQLIGPNGQKGVESTPAKAMVAF